MTEELDDLAACDGGFPAGLRGRFVHMLARKTLSRPGTVCGGTVPVLKLRGERTGP
jgi:hypothetical protein